MFVTIMNKKSLTGSELAVVQDLTEKFYGRINLDYYKKAENIEPKLFVEIKKHDAKPNSDMACKYSVHIKIEAPSVIASAHQADWDLKRALRETFANLLNELQHKFRDQSAKIEMERKVKRRNPKYRVA